MPLRSLHCLLSIPLFAGVASTARGAEVDTAALVQRTLERAEPSPGSTDWELGPVVQTPLGDVQGKYMDGYAIFRGVKYMEAPPARFMPGSEKKPWAPKVYDATKFRAACIGASSTVLEDEDCFHLNIWTPKAGGKDLPVIIYFHGGVNQRGSGAEPLRHGDLVVQSKQHPVIFINFDYRLGIFGWISGGQEHPRIIDNVGFLDQQEALRWVQKNIKYFGGDPNRVTLQGQSEGCMTILAHMVAPGSQHLFHRAVLHSPAADIWSRDVNVRRTEFMIKRSGCLRLSSTETFECLSKMPAQQLWSKDWSAEAMQRGIGSPTWMAHFFASLEFNSVRKSEETPGYIGWHPLPDGKVIPGEPRELIAQGKWNKIPVLITVSKNETIGIVPGGELATGAIDNAFKFLLEHNDVERVMAAYSDTLKDSGIHDTSPFHLRHQMLTDKVWTCEARQLAKDMRQGGGRPFLEMFWKSPKYDPLSAMTSTDCTHGATCHASEMFYVLPQGRYIGIHGPHMEKEVEFARVYANVFLSFVYGKEDTWVEYDAASQPMTFYDESGPRVVPRYRKPQCDVLDSSMGRRLPEFMKRRMDQI